MLVEKPADFPERRFCIPSGTATTAKTSEANGTAKRLFSSDCHLDPGRLFRGRVFYLSQQLADGHIKFIPARHGTLAGACDRHDILAEMHQPVFLLFTDAVDTAVIEGQADISAIGAAADDPVCSKDGQRSCLVTAVMDNDPFERMLLLVIVLGIHDNTGNIVPEDLLADRRGNILLSVQTGSAP